MHHSSSPLQKFHSVIPVQKIHIPVLALCMIHHHLCKNNYVCLLADSTKNMPRCIQNNWSIFKPQRMRKGYDSRFVCVCVCVSVTALAATYLVYMSKVRQYTVSLDFEDMHCVDFTENVFVPEIWHH